MAVSKLRLKVLEYGGPGYMVAALCGFAPARLSEYMLFQREIPVGHLRELCRILKCEPDEILGEVEESKV